MSQLSKVPSPHTNIAGLLLPLPSGRRPGTDGWVHFGLPQTPRWKLGLGRGGGRQAGRTSGHMTEGAPRSCRGLSGSRGQVCGSHRPCPYLFRAEIPGSGPGAGRPVGVLRTCLACVVGQAVAPASRRSDTRGAEDEARRGCTCVTAVTLLQTRNCPMLGGAHGQGTAPTLTASVPKVPSCHPRSHCKGEGRLPVSRLSDRKFILDAPRGRTVSPESPDVEDEDTGGVRGEGAAEEGRREGQPCGVRRPGARGAGGLRGLEGKVTTSPVALPEPRAPAPPARTVGPATFVVICCSCRRALDPVIPARPRLSPVPEASHGLCCAPGCSVAVDKPSTDTRCRPASGLCRSA